MVVLKLKFVVSPWHADLANFLYMLTSCLLSLPPLGAYIESWLQEGGVCGRGVQSAGDGPFWGYLQASCSQQLVGRLLMESMM